MERNLEKIERYLFWAIIVVFPIIVLPIFTNYFLTPKLIILSFGVGLILLVKAARIISEQKIDIESTNFDFPVLLLLAAYIISAVIRTPNRMEAFFLPGTATLMAASILFYFLLNQNRQAKKGVSLVFLVSGVVVAIFSLLSVTGVLALISRLPNFLKDKGFTLLGGNLPAFLYLVFLIPGSLSLVVNEEKFLKKMVLSVFLVLVTLGVVSNLYNILPGKPYSPRTMGFPTSWGIAVDALKNSPVFGIGPGNYLTAFNLFRPIAYNQTANWNFKFTTSNDFYINAITEVGLLGLAALILLAIVLYKNIQKELIENKLVDWGFAAKPEVISLIALIILLAIPGAEFALILPFFAYLAVNAKTTKVTLNFQTQTGEGVQKFASMLPSFLVALPIIVATLVFGFFATKAIAAEVTFNQSLNAVARNDGTGAYNLMTQAIRQNPNVDRYRSGLATVSFAIANTLSQKPAGETLTDNERTTITQLIQQAIAEGKATVALNPTRSDNWALLANLYRSIMAFAQGSDQFAIQTFSQAVALDPVNTNLRLSLGGVYYALGDYDSAIDTFKMAVLTKPDYANARYNLAVAYREKGDLDRAIAEMTNVLSLVDKDSQDYQLAKKDLDALEAKKPSSAKATEGTAELTPPQKAQEPVVKPPITLPEEAQPPVIPTSTPQASPEASPTSF